MDWSFWWKGPSIFAKTLNNSPVPDLLNDFFRPNILRPLNCEQRPIQKKKWVWNSNKKNPMDKHTYHIHMQTCSNTYPCTDCIKNVIQIRFCINVFMFTIGCMGLSRFILTVLYLELKFFNSMISRRCEPNSLFVSSISKRLSLNNY